MFETNSRTPCIIYQPLRVSNHCRNMTFIQSRPDRPGTHPTATSVDMGVLSHVSSARKLTFSPHHYLVPRLSLSGAMPLLPICIFKACMGYIYLCFLTTLLKCMLPRKELGSTPWNPFQLVSLIM